MNDLRDNSDSDLESASGGLKLSHLVLVAVVAMVVIAGVVWLLSRGQDEPPATPAPQVEKVPEGSRAVTLYFASASEPVVASEARDVAVGRRLDEQVRAVIEALIAGPAGDTLIATLPPGTRLLSVALDADVTTLYLDFSSELVSAHPGGSASEYCTVASIVRTVGDNFPEVQQVQLLVDGSQIESIAGHIGADRPFLVREWR